MPIIYVIIVLAIIGLALYLIEAYVPMAPPFKMIIRVVVVVLSILWLLQLIGFEGPAVPRVR